MINIGLYISISIYINMIDITLEEFRLYSDNMWDVIYLRVFSKRYLLIEIQTQLLTSPFTFSICNLNAFPST